ncbi:MAG: M949_RS01915 family surface polysaccharide biosynthesis protein, partial [Bacteroidota bacterium]
TSEIFARQYAMKDNAGKPKLLWELYDIEKDCIFDLTLDFMGDTPYVTDIDKDGVTETTLIYKVACRSDVSPAYMKIIMHEREKKYALRGNMRVQSGEEEMIDLDSITNWDISRMEGNHQYEWGFYETAKDFDLAPEFLPFAQKLWKDNIVEQL